MLSGKRKLLTDKGNVSTPYMLAFVILHPEGYPCERDDDEQHVEPCTARDV